MEGFKNKLVNGVKTHPRKFIAALVIVMAIIVLIVVMRNDKPASLTARNTAKAVGSAVSANSKAVAANKAAVVAATTATNAALASAAANLTRQQAVDAALSAKMDATNSNLLNAVKQYEDAAAIAQINAEKAAVAAESVYNQAVFATVASDDATRAALMAIAAEKESIAAQDRLDAASSALSKTVTGSLEEAKASADLVAAQAAALAAEKEREVALAAAAAAAIAAQPITGIKYYIKTGLNRPLKIRTAAGSVAGNPQSLQKCDPINNLGDCQWVFEKSARTPGAYYIRASDNADLYLAASSGFALGSPQSLIACDPANQNLQTCQWEFIPSATNEGTMYIKSAAGNLYLTTQSADKQNPDLGDTLQLDICNSNENVAGCQWLLLPMVS